MKPNTYTIQQISGLTGLSAHTLRYYEKIGLLRDVERDISGYRQYTDKDLAWIEFLIRLKETGMKISDMILFSDLRSQGDTTASQRRALLESHHKEVILQIAGLMENVRAIEDKIKHYKNMEERDS